MNKQIMSELSLDFRIICMMRASDTVSKTVLLRTQLDYDEFGGYSELVPEMDPDSWDDWCSAMLMGCEIAGEMRYV